MARDEGLPSPRKKGRGEMGPQMAQEDPSIYGKLSQLADKGGGAEMGGGGEDQSAQMLMQGAQMLMQAAQANPQLAPIIQQAVSILQQGVQGMVGGQMEGMGASPSPEGGGGKRKRVRPPKRESGSEAGMSDQFAY